MDGMEMLANQLKKFIPPELLAEIEGLRVKIPEFAKRAQEKLVSIDDRLDKIQQTQALQVAQLEYIQNLLTCGAGSDTVRDNIDPSKDIIHEVTNGAIRST